jgi:hypothetical protein
LNNDQEKQILNVIQCVENWPSIVFKNNKQIRQILRNRGWLAISGYSLYTIDNDGIANIYINSQVNLMLYKGLMHIIVFPIFSFHS